MDHKSDFLKNFLQFWDGPFGYMYNWSKSSMLHLHVNT